MSWSEEKRFQNLSRIIKHEGGYQCDPNDKGNYVGSELRGTKYGISASSYPELNIKDLSYDDAIKIYETDYFTKYNLEKFPGPMQFQLLDTIINCGYGSMVRILQRACGVTVDGLLGPATVRAVNESSIEGLILRFNSCRIQHYLSLKTFDKFGKGWIQRCATNLIYGAEDVASFNSYAGKHN